MRPRVSRGGEKGNSLTVGSAELRQLPAHTAPLRPAAGERTRADRSLGLPGIHVARVHEQNNGRWGVKGAKRAAPLPARLVPRDEGGQDRRIRADAACALLGCSPGRALW
ncbi:hypothetical protein TRVL_01995 [Trypanosoma vivax]|nr:hypothetical protein TRVL_01995 [Trypanosoma vivax]